MLLVLLLCVTPFSADKVEIIKENGESVVYLVGNVAIEDEHTKITCAEARLNEAQKYVILLNHVIISDKSGTINADYARYYFDDRRGYLSGNVTLTRSEEIISADSLYYNGMEEVIEMFRNVVIEDKKNDMIAQGGRGWYNLKDDEGHLVDNPVLEILREQKEPITLWAQEFHLKINNDEFLGYDSVKAIIDSITVYCDTFLYNLKSEHGILTMPHIVEKNNELSGQTGQFTMKEKNIESFRVAEGTSTYYTKEGSKNIVEGSEIRIIFDEGKATTIFVEGNPKGILSLKKAVEDAGD